MPSKQAKPAWLGLSEQLFDLWEVERRARSRVIKTIVMTPNTYCYFHHYRPLLSKVHQQWSGTPLRKGYCSWPAG